MALTWRNVDGPDFSRSLDGIRTFGNLFGDAVQNLDRGLSTFDRAIDNRANNQLLLNFAGIQDPEVAKARLAALATDPNAARFNAGTISAVTGRPTELLAQKVSELGLERDAYNLGESRRRNEADMRLGDVLPGYYNAADKAGFIKANPTAFAGQGGRILSEVLTGGQQFDTGAETLLGSKQNRTQGATLFAQGQEDRKFNQDAAAWVGRAQQFGSAEDAQAFVMKNIADPRMRGAVMGQLGFGGFATPASDILSSVAGGGGGGDPTRLITSGGAGNLGLGSLPDSVKTLGDAADFAKQLNARGQESSAMGVYQIVGQTLRGKDGDNGYAKKALGAGWRTAPMNFENQDKIAEAIFNDHRGSSQALTNQWTSLKAYRPEQIEAIRKMPWAQAREFIAKGESSSSPAALAGTQMRRADANLGIVNSRASVNMDSMIQDYAKVVGGPSQTPGEAAASLLADPSFKGLSQQDALKQVQLVQSYGRKLNRNIPANVAALILRNAPNSDKGWWFGTSAFGGGAVDEKQVRSLVDRYANGEFDNAVRANTALDIQTQQTGAAEQALARATQAYQAGVAQARAGRVVNLDRLRADVMMAEAGVQGAVNGQRSLGTFGAPPQQAQPSARRGSAPPPVPSRAAAAIKTAAVNGAAVPPAGPQRTQYITRGIAQANYHGLNKRPDETDLHYAIRGQLITQAKAGGAKPQSAPQTRSLSAKDQADLNQLMREAAARNGR